MQYFEHVVERSMMDLLGITEAGAESPWEEASDLIQKDSSFHSYVDGVSHEPITIEWRLIILELESSVLHRIEHAITAINFMVVGHRRSRRWAQIK